MWASGSLTNIMAKELRLGLMELASKANILMAKRMVKGRKNGLTAHLTKASGRIITCTVVDSIVGLMVRHMMALG